MNETSINIAVGQGANLATEFLKDKEFNKADFKTIAREIADVIFELREEFIEKANQSELNNTEPA